MEPCFFGLKFSNVIISACFTKMKKEFKACLQKKSKKHEKKSKQKADRKLSCFARMKFDFPM